MKSFEIDPDLCFALAGSFAIWLWTRPPMRAWLAVVAVAIALRVIAARTFTSMGMSLGVEWISCGAALGIATLAALVVLGERRTFFVAAIFPLCALFIGYTIPLTTWINPRTLDGLLLNSEVALGIPPSFALGRLVIVHSWLWAPTVITYYMLPLAISILYGWHRLQDRDVKLLPLLLSMMVVGALQSSLFPASGPAYAFHGFYPFALPREIPLDPMLVKDAVRNCMPSLHFASALIVWWNTRLAPRAAQLAAFVFLVGTGFATLALGEHYVADLVVAVPFALIFQAAWTNGVRNMRTLAIIVGCVLMAAWLIALRWGTFSHALPNWTAIALTVAGCAAALHALRLQPVRAVQARKL